MEIINAKAGSGTTVHNASGPVVVLSDKPLIAGILQEGEFGSENYVICARSVGECIVTCRTPDGVETQYKVVVAA